MAKRPELRLLFNRALLPACVTIVALTARVGRADEVASGSLQAKPRFTIGRDTTYITQPLRAGGYPDYIAALNEHAREGVTPENNAAVLLMRAFGPAPIPQASRETYFRELGISPLPENGNYLISRDEFKKGWREKHPPKLPFDDDDLEPQWNATSAQPWTAAKYPMVAAWVAANEKPLALILEASRQPKLYFPLAPGADGLILSTPLEHLQEVREAAALMATKAMLLTASGKTEQAWHSLIACHRLARQVAAYDSVVIGVLIGYAIEETTCQADMALIYNARLSAQALRKMRIEFDALPPLTGPTPQLDFGERLIVLDVIVETERQGPNALDFFRRLTGAPPAKPSIESKIVGGLISTIDWDVPLRMTNEWFDKLTRATRIADRHERRAALDEYSTELHKLTGDIKNGRKLLSDFLTKGSPTELLSSRFGALVIGLLTPALQAVVVAYERIELERQMIDVAFALEEYKAARGSYPEKLDALVTAYLRKVPDDTLNASGGPIGYRREGKAYMLWSAHVDGINDNGRSYDDDPSGDDWVLRPVPAKK